MYDDYKRSDSKVAYSEYATKDIELKELINIANKYGVYPTYDLVAYYRRNGFLERPQIKGLGRGLGRASFYSKSDAASFVSSILMIRNSQKTLEEVKIIRAEALEWLANGEFNIANDDLHYFIILWADRFLRVCENIDPNVFVSIIRERQIKEKKFKYLEPILHPIANASWELPHILMLVINDTGRVVKIVDQGPLTQEFPKQEIPNNI